MATKGSELANVILREMDLAPLVGRYLDERQAGLRAMGEMDDLIMHVDGMYAAEARELFTFIDALIAAGSTDR